MTDNMQSGTFSDNTSEFETTETGSELETTETDAPTDEYYDEHEILSDVSNVRYCLACIAMFILLFYTAFLGALVGWVLTKHACTPSQQ